MRQQSIYKADLAGVALKIQESRVIALWLLEQAAGKTEKSWDELIYRDNEVQIRGRSTLRRQANLVRARLQTARLKRCSVLLPKASTGRRAKRALPRRLCTAVFWAILWIF